VLIKKSEFLLKFINICHDAALLGVAEESGSSVDCQNTWKKDPSPGTGV
jgi:hypothetical protein